MLLTQSSCSKEATCDGGTRARTYSTFKVVSAEIPLAVRNSSIEVRRNWPLIRNSKGTGCSVSRRRLTRVESWYLRSSATIVSYVTCPRKEASCQRKCATSGYCLPVETRIGPVSSGNSISGLLVLS